MTTVLGEHSKMVLNPDEPVAEFSFLTNQQNEERNMLNELAQEIHETAKSKGWWESDRNPLELHMLIVTEIAEASEAVRSAEPDFYLDEDGKPQGESAELMDCIIRILDYAGHKGWDLDTIMRAKNKYNKTRSYRHGGKTA